MVVYAVASALLAALIKPILDQVLPNRERLGAIATAVVILYFVKGVGAYFSDFLMEDVGQRVVMDVRGRLYGHILGQSAGFFSRHTTGQLLSRVSNDVSQIQRAVSETAGDLLQESLARTSRLIAALKRQRRQSRAVQSAVASLRKLRHLGE